MAIFLPLLDRGSAAARVQHCSRAKLLVVVPIGHRNSSASRSHGSSLNDGHREPVAAFAHMSIGLMPLADTVWCNGKCSYKMLCYMSAGLPVVVTAAGMNREVLAMGDVGLECRLRAAVGRCAHRTAKRCGPAPAHGRRRALVVEERFSLQRLAQQYAAVFHSLGGDLPRGSGSRIVAHSQ